MTSEQFCHWLRGFAELSIVEQPTAEQWKSIKEHLATVFNQITPPFNNPPPSPLTYLPPAPWPKRLTIPFDPFRPIITC